MRTDLGQLFFIGVSGFSLTEAEKKFIVENNIGGIVLYSRNVQSPEQLHSLCSEIQALRTKTADKAPLFIGIDMEGGRVAQLREPFTVWPPLKHLGDIDSPTLSFHFAYAMGRELRAVGINTDFAPCVDIFTNPQNTIIGDRSIGTDPELVAKHASALVRGYLKAEVIPCVKHFPGHGNTLVDSHDDLPVETADTNRLENVELKPFAKSFRSRAPMMMTGHLSFPNVDSEWPVTLSEVFLKKIAREEMRFRGLIVADDLDMKAMALHYGPEQIPVRAVEAGIDLLMYCHAVDSAPKPLAALEKAVRDGRLSLARIQEIKKRILEMKAELLHNPDPWPLPKALPIIGCPDHQKISQAMRANRVPEGLVPPKD